MAPRAANDNTRFLAADAASVATAVADILAAYPELAEDEELRLDTIEGETNAFDILERLLLIEREAATMQVAIKKRADELDARAARQKRTQEAMRKLMLRIMQAGGVQKLPLPDATLSITKGRQSIEIIDEKAVPPRFLKVVKSPDKVLIKEALEAGKKVKGAEFKIGDPTLAVRVA